MRKTYYPGDIVTVLNVSSHYQVYDHELYPDSLIKDLMYSDGCYRELKQTIQGQLYYVHHFDHDRQYILLKFAPHINYSFTAAQIALYRRPLRNHIKALVQWLRHTFYFSKPVIKP